MIQYVGRNEQKMKLRVCNKSAIMGIKTLTHATLGNVVILAFLVGKIKSYKIIGKKKKGAKRAVAFSSRLTAFSLLHHVGRALKSCDWLVMYPVSGRPWPRVMQAI